ncbi:MAG: hypothetical protein JWR62_1008, partial [Modestobacter sp.]|nr:hypothetical protein [Modestobacter sp.]
MKADRDVQENHGGSRRAWALSCRVAVALGVGGALLLLLGGGVLALAHDHVTLDPTRSPSAALGLAVGTVGAVLLVASVALTTTVSAIALLVRDHLEGRHPHLGRTLATAVATTPGALLVGLAAAAVTGLLVVLAPVVVIAALAATGWRLAR